MKKKIYVGLKLNTHEHVLFKVDSIPLWKDWGHQYSAFIGPFRTVRGAQFMIQFGKDNPHCQCVDDAERLANPSTIYRKFRDSERLVAVFPKSKRKSDNGKTYVEARIEGHSWITNHEYKNLIKQTTRAKKSEYKEFQKFIIHIDQLNPKD